MIKAGFIGTGNISGAHLRYLKGRRDVKIAALCDINRKNALQRQKDFGGDVFTDFDEMLAHVKPDAVWICTPPSVRRAHDCNSARNRRTASQTGDFPPEAGLPKARSAGGGSAQGGNGNRRT